MTENLPCGRFSACARAGALFSVSENRETGPQPRRAAARLELWSHITYYEVMEFFYGTSTKADGNMSATWGPPEEADDHRKRFLFKNGLKLDDCVFTDLQHGDGIAVVGEGDKGKTFKVDALLTRAPGTVLFLMTADCFPVAYCDAEKNAVALAHLGWKSSDLGLAGKVVENMVREFQSNPKDIEVFFGPGIQRESYLVKEPAQKNDPRWEPFLEETMGFIKIDLVGFNLNALTEAGIERANITVSSENTASSPEYFSHFRAVKTGEQEGRFATVVALR